MNAATPARDATAPDRARLVIDIVRDSGDWSSLTDVDSLINGAAAALAAHPDLDIEDGATAAIALADDAMVRNLNKRFRNQDKPTNVLSFPVPDDGVMGDDAPPLGDIVFALETITREAAAMDIPLAHHVQHLTVHGLLHLLGFDHQTEDEAREMEALETSILARVGVPDPYANSDPLPP